MPSKKDARLEELEALVSLTAAEACTVTMARDYLEAYKKGNRHFPISTQQAEALLEIAERLVEWNSSADKR